MGWRYSLDRTPKGNVVVLRRGLLQLRIPQRMWQTITDALFPQPAAPLSRWDVGGWDDLDGGEQAQIINRRAFGMPINERVGADLPDIEE